MLSFLRHRKRVSKFALLSIVLPSTLVLAQVQPPVTCGQVLPAVDKSVAACVGVADNQVCYGSPAVTANFQITSSPDQTPFAKAGDTIGLNAIQSLTTSPLDLTQNQWGVAVIKAGIGAANTASSGSAGPAVTLIQYGAANITVANPSTGASAAPTDTPALCSTTLKVASLLRSAPNGGKVVQTLPIGTKVMIYGRLSDSSWVFVDSSGKSGWLQPTSLGTLSGDCAVSKLLVIDPKVSAIMPALIGFSFSIGDSSSVLCRDIPTGGLLLQSPAGRKVTFAVDGTQLTLDSAIAVLSASPDQSLNVAVLDGQANVTAHAGSVDIPVGKQVSIPLGGVAGLDAIGAPGILTNLQPFSGATDIYLKTLCDLAASVNLQIPCTLAAAIRPTLVSPPISTPKPIIP
ncbi:MAG: SH3 domain-containing protein [Aggregatilineales bacterium]